LKPGRLSLEAAPRVDSDVMRYPVVDGELLLFPRALAADSQRLYARIMAQTPWEQHVLRLFGRQLPAPRLSAWYGEPGCDYAYSGQRLCAQPLTPVLREIQDLVERLSQRRFNCVLLNLYRDGRDSMGWHSDDEAELGTAPDIASLSLGATRRFLLRHRFDRAQRLALDLADGSLLLMRAPMQASWQHCVPKTSRQVAPRINLTWRYIEPA